MGRVLIVDDESLVVHSLRLVLSDEFIVGSTTDPAEALAWLVAGDWYDVILCDVMMPTMNGIELRDRVQVARPELADRIVFVTGGIYWAPVRELLEGVTNLILEKPFDFDGLRELIRRRIARGPQPKRASRS